MFRKLLEQLKKPLGLEASENGMKGEKSPVEMLRNSARILGLLARQIDAHAVLAPYPHVAGKLHELAREKQNLVDLLEKELSRIGEELGPLPSEIKSGRNHWDRMRLDLEDQRSLEGNCLAQAGRLAESAPHISDLLKQVASQQALHSNELLEILIRADPQAHQT